MIFNKYKPKDITNTIEFNRKSFVDEINYAYEHTNYEDMFEVLFAICLKYNSFKKQINAGKFDLVTEDTYCIYNELNVSDNNKLGSLLLRFTMFDISKENAQKRFNNLYIKETND